MDFTPKRNNSLNIIDFLSLVGVVFKGESCQVDEAALAAHVKSIVEQGLPGGGAQREKLSATAAGSASVQAKL